VVKGTQLTIFDLHAHQYFSSGATSVVATSPEEKTIETPSTELQIEVTAETVPEADGSGDPGGDSQRSPSPETIETPSTELQIEVTAETVPEADGSGDPGDNKQGSPPPEEITIETPFAELQIEVTAETVPEADGSGDPGGDSQRSPSPEEITIETPFAELQIEVAAETVLAVDGSGDPGDNKQGSPDNEDNSLVVVDGTSSTEVSPDGKIYDMEFDAELVPNPVFTPPSTPLVVVGSTMGTILTMNHMNSLLSKLPLILQSDKWFLLYSVLHNGADFSAFFSHTAGRYTVHHTLII
jgi:hypothetical protein